MSPNGPLKNVGNKTSHKIKTLFVNSECFADLHLSENRTESNAGASHSRILRGKVFMSILQMFLRIF